MKSNKREIAKAVDALEGEILEFARHLIKIPSIVGSEGRAQEFIKETFQNMELDTHLVEARKSILEKHPEYCEVPWDYDNRPNVIGVLKGEKNKKSIILNGHIDVVSPGPSELWSYDPWGAVIDQGNLYGRGAWDMKAGMAAMIYAVKAIQDTGIELYGDVIIESVIEEEAGGGGGTLTTLLNGIRADAAIIPEPTSLNIWLASSGVNYFRIRVEGKTAHPLRASSGVDAIEKAWLIYNALRRLRDRRRSETRYSLFDGEADYACDLNIGIIRGGDWPSAVSAWAEMECRVSFTPNEDGESIKKLIEATISQESEKDPWLRDHPPRIAWFGWNAQPSEQSPNHPLVQLVREVAADETGNLPQFKGFPGGLDTRLFIRNGGIPSFCFGPRGGGIHGVDEFVIIDDIFRVTRVLARCICEWLG